MRYTFTELFSSQFSINELVADYHIIMCMGFCVGLLTTLGGVSIEDTATFTFNYMIVTYIWTYLCKTVGMSLYCMHVVGGCDLGFARAIERYESMVGGYVWQDRNEV